LIPSNKLHIADEDENCAHLFILDVLSHTNCSGYGWRKSHLGRGHIEFKMMIIPMNDRLPEKSRRSVNTDHPGLALILGLEDEADLVPILYENLAVLKAPKRASNGPLNHAISRKSRFKS
jgi:hypothetical protein